MKENNTHAKKEWIKFKDIKTRREKVQYYKPKNKLVRVHVKNLEEYKESKKKEKSSPVMSAIKDKVHLSHLTKSTRRKSVNYKDNEIIKIIKITKIIKLQRL